MNKKWIFWIIAAICVLGGIIYFVSPFDIIPDFISFVGLLDDLAINLLTIAAIGINICAATGILPLREKEQEYVYEEEYGYYEER